MPNKPKALNAKKKTVREPRPQYGYQHQQLRKEVLRLHPICMKCLKHFSYHAHHLIPNATTVDHYLALCEQCHIEIHRKE